MTQRLLAVLHWATLIVTLAGCSQHPDASSPRVAAMQDTARAHATPAARRTLAYHHTLAIDVAEERVATVFEAGQSACRAMTPAVCTIMRAELNRPSDGHADARDGASATLTLRALPTAIPRLLAAFGKDADVTRQSTSAEELAGPLEDVAKKLALLRDYRDKLEGLRVRAANDIDSLIKVNHELAQVQAELEATAGAQATLQLRVDTELLDVAIRSQAHRAFWRPITASLREFGPSLSEGTAFAISGAAWLLPWVVMLGFAIWLVRKLWRRRRSA